MQYCREERVGKLWPQSVVSITQTISSINKKKKKKNVLCIQKFVSHAFLTSAGTIILAASYGNAWNVFVCGVHALLIIHSGWVIRVESSCYITWYYTRKRCQYVIPKTSWTALLRKNQKSDMHNLEFIQTALCCFYHHGKTCPFRRACSDGICFTLEESRAICNDGHGRLITQG